MRVKKLWKRTTVKGHTNTWKTWPLWNKGKLLLSKIVQENASQTNDKYWTDKENTALSCTITIPTEIHQYWTSCPQTDTEVDHPILRKEMEAAVQSIKKEKSAGVDNTPAELFQTGREDVITALTTICNKVWQTGEWPTPWTFQRKATRNSARTNKRSAWSVTQAKSCWRSCWTDRSRKRRSLLKSRQASEQEGAPQNRSLTYESSVWNISGASKTSTRSS